ncbi:tubulin-specific chaperone C [Trypanosoma rangeli]|uniref:Tubulin-specific chaperone C n=1 Tax=Trypanosoma rangeli TaxID=5698 RepID=A0A3R7L226_TRYRA|nr:tubulin-specific chaperone C [Trypanosoma rangeli]RNF06035.1 tubulin-specific chaperone C [Trypanosoma rangeli]|eukprot:RNF06035.1 tubulin-specific chaperone C [Trypanosoma rangeli]
MEERFLKTRAEREEARQQKAAISSSVALDKLEFERQAKDFERDVAQLLRDGDTRAAQDGVKRFQRLVQEATSNDVLTSHEMAKSNATLARLQGLIDAKHDTAGRAKAFKFSSQPKSRGAVVEGEQHAASFAFTSASNSSLPCRSEGQSCAGNVYGYAREQTLCVGPAKAVFLRECERCEVLILPVPGSVFISDCANCKVYVACHQLRLKNCTNVDVYVWCASTPIIECCSGMRFGPYSCWTGLLQSSVEGHAYATHEEWVGRLGELRVEAHTKNAYQTVDDFQWLKKTPSPHWGVLPQEAWEMSLQRFLQEVGPAAT